MGCGRSSSRPRTVIGSYSDRTCRDRAMPDNIKSQGWAMSGGQLSRRTLLAAMATAPFVSGANAQSVQAAWPTRPVSVMVPYPPAGGADTTARILYARVGTILGQLFVIENRGEIGRAPSELQ